MTVKQVLTVDAEIFAQQRHGEEMERQREALAVLLWDFFGPKLPKLSEARILNSRPATPREIANYRTTAAFIISSMRSGK